MENEIPERPAEMEQQREAIMAAHRHMIAGDMDKVEECLDRADRLGRTAKARLESRV
jgi:hypothetical protein